MRPRPMRLTARPTQRLGLGPPPQGTVDPYLKTATHKQWAAFVLKRAGYRCEWVEAGQRCTVAYPPHRLVADHVIERRDDMSKANDPANGRALCVRHHQIKTQMARAKRMRE